MILTHLVSRYNPFSANLMQHEHPDPLLVPPIDPTPLRSVLWSSIGDLSTFPTLSLIGDTGAKLIARAPSDTLTRRGFTPSSTPNSGTVGATHSRLAPSATASLGRRTFATPAA